MGSVYVLRGRNVKQGFVYVTPKSKVLRVGSSAQVPLVSAKVIRCPHCKFHTRINKCNVTVASAFGLCVRRNIACLWHMRRGKNRL